MEYSKWVASSQLVAPGPIYLLHVALTASTAGAADVTIRDGISDDGEIIVFLRAAAGTTKSLALGGNILLTTGLYVELGANADGALVVYRPVAREG